MHLAVAGHVAIDHIIMQSGPSLVSLGGPPSYAGLTSIQFGVETTAVTKVGYEFPDEYMSFLTKNALNFAGNIRSTTRPTTRFQIRCDPQGRALRLLSRCEDIEPQQIEGLSGDGVIVSPIAGEISSRFVEKASDAFGHLYLDPQGFLRRFSAEGECTLASMDTSILSKAQFVKVDPDESLRLTGESDPVRSLHTLRRLGVETPIATDAGGTLRILVRNRVYVISPPSMDVCRDTTGAGDIFAGVFMATFLREADPVWSACVASSAASLAVKHQGISKIPRCDEVLEAAQLVRERVT